MLYTCFSKRSKFEKLNSNMCYLGYCGVLRSTFQHVSNMSVFLMHDKLNTDTVDIDTTFYGLLGVRINLTDVW